MYIIVGLGNPGAEYRKTRHNVGFNVIEILADRYSIATDYIKHKAICGKGIIEANKVILAMPQTYMNLSGEAVIQAVRFYKIPADHVLVISDEISLPPGKLRIRTKGSAGGHNGIKSIQSHLGTDAFPRFRIGIGHPQHDREIVIDHVLTKFSPKEKEIMEPAIESMALAAETWLTEDIDSVMNKFNTKKTKKEEEKSPIDQTKHKDACD